MALSRVELQQAVDLLVQYGSVRKAAAACGMSPSGFQKRLKVAEFSGITPGIGTRPLRQPSYPSQLKQPPWAAGHTPEEERGAPSEEEMLRSEIKTLKSALATRKAQDISFEAIKREMLGILNHTVDPPKWLTSRKRATGGVTGTPTLFCSDWHWGEEVRPQEVYGSNEFDLQIAQKRVQKLWDRARDLLFEHIKNPSYDGLVLALGGDMVSGDIHDELRETNSAPIMAAVDDIIDTLVWLVMQALDSFEYVYVPAVTGNHGRNTRRPRYKERGPTNFDWLIYRRVQAHFKNNPRVHFDIPDGPDISYQVYGHRYLLTHGDQFRGGDGMIGPLGPITRGRHKKQSRNQPLNLGFDTMICGHFHNLTQLPHLVVNGSLKGYDEFAFGNNFPWERASQALWVTHPEHGITLQMPIYVDEDRSEVNPEWISFIR